MSKIFSEMMPDNFLEFMASSLTIGVSYWAISFYRSKYFNEKQSKQQLEESFKCFIQEKKEQLKDKELELEKKYKDKVLSQEVLKKLKEVV